MAQTGEEWAAVFEQYNSGEFTQTCILTQPYKQTDIQIHRQTDIQIDRQTYRHTYRQTDIEIHTQTDRHTDRQIDTDRQTDRQTVDAQTGTVSNFFCMFILTWMRNLCINME